MGGGDEDDLGVRESGKIIQVFKNGAECDGERGGVGEE